MTKCLTTEEFIKRAKKVHGDKYDYSKVEYVNSGAKVTIICKKHGRYDQSPSCHVLAAKGCPKCGQESSVKSRAVTTAEFIRKARKVHGDKYDYSKVNYSGNRATVTIICRNHGEFTQKPLGHLNGCGCQLCGKIKRAKSRTTMTKGVFVERARKVHGNKYDYSKVKVNKNSAVTIICPEHGEFRQGPYRHISGSKCLKCAAAMRTLTTGDFIERARKAHGNKYDYSKVVYGTNNRQPVIIICPEHGEFNQKPVDHLNGRGCTKCSLDAKSAISYEAALPFCVGTEEFIKRAKKVHGDKYDYFNVDYRNNYTHVIVTCSKHGDFKVNPKNHLNGSGCRNCSSSVSKGEKEMVGFIKSLIKTRLIENTRSIISPYELDAYIPEMGLAFEYNGEYWHSEKFGKGKDYHDMKKKVCKENGIKLVYIWESEWRRDREASESKIKATLSQRRQ